MITDTTFFTNEPGYTLLDRFKKTLKHVSARFPKSALLKVNKSLVREGVKLRYPKGLRIKMFGTIIEAIKKVKLVSKSPYARSNHKSGRPSD